jgi:hypothetical protein
MMGRCAAQLLLVLEGSEEGCGSLSHPVQPAALGNTPKTAGAMPAMLVRTSFER